MANIKIALDLDSNDSKDLQVFINLLTAFGGNSTLNPVIDETYFHKKRDKPSEEVSEDPKISTTEIRDYSEDELKAMDNSTLKDVATGLGIEWEKAEGKNTNAKLIRLILSVDEKADEGKEEYVTESKEKAETAQESTENISTGKTTLNELKVKLGEKVDANRDEIVAKLKEFGSSKLSNLPEEHYDAMYTYLNSLK